MDDAQYYRARAALTLQIADQISDSHDAAGLRTLAAEYEAKAAALDAETSAGGPSHNSSRDTAE